MAAHVESDSEEGSSAFEEPEPAESISGLLLSRDVGAALLGVEIVSESMCLVRDDIGSVQEYGKPVFTADEFLAWAAKVCAGR